MTAAQILTPDFISKLAGAADNFYDKEEGVFRDGYDQFHDAGGQSYLVMAALLDQGVPVKLIDVIAMPDDTGHPCHGDGYSFALVDSRYLVDLWAKSYGDLDKILYDLNDPADAQHAEHMYGPRANWKEGGVNPRLYMIAMKVWHQFVVPYNAVDDLLSGEG